MKLKRRHFSIAVAALLFKLCLAGVAWGKAGKPQLSLSAWEVAVWTSGVLVAVIGAVKIFEWALQSSGVWEKPDQKILRRLDEVDAKMVLVEERSREFLVQWSVAKAQIKYLNDLHHTPMGERPTWWCAVRERPYRESSQHLENRIEVMNDLLAESVRNEQRIIALLRASLRRQHINNVDEIEDDF